MEVSDTSVIGISGYVKQNQEVLSAENYTPEDALVFSQLSYTKFEKVYGEDYSKKSVTVQEYAKDVLNAQNDLEADDKAFLMEIMNSDRYSNCTMSQFAAENNTSQWAAVTIKMNDKSDSAVIAMRGTDGTILGWTEDLELAYDVDGTEAQKISAEYLQNSQEGNIYLAGHSKGGNDVSSAYAMSDADTRSKVIRIDNFDGPGVNSNLKNVYAEGYMELDEKLCNYYPQDSVIGLLLNDNPGKTSFVQSSDEDGLLWEHSPYNWKFDKDGCFEYTEQSDLSEFINDVTDNSINYLPQFVREKVTNVLIKMGVPALIAQESPFTEDTTIYDVIGAGASLYLELESGGAFLLKTTLKAMLAFSAIKGAEMLAESVYQKTQEMEQKLYEAYEKAADYLEKSKKAAADAVRSFADSLKDTMKNLAETITSLFEYKKADKGGYAGSLKQVRFSVELKGIENCKKQLELCENSINYNQMRMVSTIAKLALYADFASACNLGKLTLELEREEKSCRKLADLLGAAEKQYRTYEQNILNFV